MSNNLQTLKETLIPKKEQDIQSPVNYDNLFKEANDFFTKGKELYKKKNYKESIDNFQGAYNIIQKELEKISDDIETKKKEELLNLFKKIMSNLSLCYFILENYQKSIEFDLQIIPLYPKYDRAFGRLFKSYMKLNKVQQALYYGNLLLNSDKETKEKYADLIPEIKQLQIKNDKERSKNEKDLIKYIPLVILIIAVLFYCLFNKKHKNNN